MSFIDTIATQLLTHAQKALVSEVHGDAFVPADGALLADLVARARTGLELGEVKPGDRVVVVGPNSIRWVAADLACLFAGAIVVPLYDRQDPSELGFMIDDCEPTLILAADNGLADALAPHTDVPIVLFADLFAHGPIVAAPVQRDPADPVTIVYTSGTSGHPKGVVLSVANVDYMLPRTRDAIQAMMGSRSGDDRVFHYLPFCFAGSRVVLWTCLFRGNGIHVSTDLDNLATEFKAVKPNYFLNVPMLLERIKNGVEAKIRERPAPVQWLYDQGKRAAFSTRKRDRVLASVAKRVVFDKIRDQIGADLECLICGSAPLGPDTQRWFQMIGIPVYQVYGLTETTAIVTMDVPPEVLPGHVGKALSGVQTKLADDGELLVKGPNVFQGYWRREEATAEAFDNGWFRTGDRAEVDANGNWRILGRARNLLVPTSGHNVAPEPLEQSITETLEGADAALVVGHGRPYLTAVISGTGVSSEAADAAIDVLNQSLPHYRRIRRWVLAPEPFTIENGLLTANRKLKRDAIEAAHAAQIDGMYA